MRAGVIVMAIYQVILLSIKALGGISGDVKVLAMSRAAANE